MVLLHVKEELDIIRSYYYLILLLFYVQACHNNVCRYFYFHSYRGKVLLNIFYKPLLISFKS